MIYQTSANSTNSNQKSPNTIDFARALVSRFNDLALWLRGVTRRFVQLERCTLHIKTNKWSIRFVWLEISETSSSTLHPHECYSNTDTHWQIAWALRISFRKCRDMFLLRDLRNMGTSIGIKKPIFNLKMAYPLVSHVKVVSDREFLVWFTRNKSCEKLWRTV